MTQAEVLAKNLLDICLDKALTVTTAESCTAGLISGAITHHAGSSAIFERGFVTYSNAAKIEMLDVSAHTLEHYGAVSERVAQEMANGARIRANADWAISVTGIAGPGGSEHKPEGRVCFGISGKVQHTETRDFGALGRSKVRSATVEHALRLLISHINAT